MKKQKTLFEKTSKSKRGAEISASFFMRPQSEQMISTVIGFIMSEEKLLSNYKKNCLTIAYTYVII